MKINNRERELWIDNDEGLYMLWKTSRLPKRKFIKDYKNEIDDVILKIVEGKRSPHYLIYG